MRIRLAAQQECSAAAPSAASYGDDVAAGGLHRQADGPALITFVHYARARGGAEPAAGRFSFCESGWRRMPWQFALPAGTGDVATGIVAIVVAVLLARNAVGAHRATYAWCLFEIADLVVAITMGAMTSPGRPHLLAFDAPNLLVTAYPLVMVPTFAVPLALMLHGLVLLRLRRGATATGRLAAA